MRKMKALVAGAALIVATLGLFRPAQATTCYVENPVDAAMCAVYGTPIAGDACKKLKLC